MKVTALLFFLSSHIVLAQGQPEETQVQQVIINFFEGLSENDLDGMRQCVSDDFTILEHGVVWTMDTIVALTTNPRPDGFKRLNEFDFFQSMVSGNMAFVSYHNKAEITMPGKRRTVRWLESAVLVKEGGRWKIKMLHSTRLPK
ncbi:MAG: nuclear transport factor 2 family protein [Chryseosolibacter sp.]